MKSNAIIKGITSYHPAHVVGNEFFLEHFSEKGEDISGLLRTTGRKNRYISDNKEENTLTMAAEAAKDLIDSMYIKPSEIGMVVFTSGTPEYMLPPDSVKLHETLGIGSRCCCYDLNANCGGMVVALDQVSRAMQSNHNIKYALITGSDQLGRYCRFDEALGYANFGDSGCAIILENIFDTDRGIQDSDYYTNSANHDKMVFPYKGLSNIVLDKKIPTQDKLLVWNPFDYSGVFHSAVVSIEDILFRNGLEKKDIKRYFMSQFSYGSIKGICDELGENMDKFTFIGDEYGYTGTTSPLLAYQKALENNEIGKGDYVIFWTVGAGTTCVCTLYKC